MSIYNSKLFLDPQLTYPSELAEHDFQNYITHCHTLIQNSRLDLTNNSQANIVVEANSPFELKPAATARTGIILLHGLYDSPFIMKDIATHLQSQNCMSRAILLPGHGTTPGALLNTRFQEWIDAAAYGIRGLAKEVDKLWICGFSTGANVAIYHALQNKIPQLAGIILIAPALKISAVRKFTHLPPKLSRQLDWFHKGCENDYTKYSSFTFNSIYQIHLLIEEIAKMKQKLNCPLLMILSKDDQTVESSGAMDFFQRYATADSQMILYSNNKNDFSDPRISWRTATYPEWNIENISHICLPVKADNFHYGLAGDYPDASHAETNNTTGKKAIYGEPTSLQRNILNKLHNWKLYPYRYERLTFNPDFDYLKTAVSDFIHSRL